MKKSAILAIDQGTTGTRAILYGYRGEILGSAYQEFPQYFPHPGFVEHNADEIWQSTLNVIHDVLKKRQHNFKRVHAIGITNQRETTVLWDKRTGRPVHKAIVWQDRRTAKYCDQLKKRGYESVFRNKTGLVVDPYFSGTKITWLLQHVPGLRTKAQRGDILFGTIDTWLLWKLTGGKSHATDFTNASRTLLFNIKTLKWDSELLKILRVPSKILPHVQDSASHFGNTVKVGQLPEGIPIYSMVGDQQAALHGQACYEAGSVKNTYGTGCFIVMNMGRKFKKAPFGLLQTIACDEGGKPVYALEGSIFIAGAAIQWLRDGLQFFKKASETELLIKKITDSGGVTVIPAFAGLGSPYWNAHVRGAILGITRGTKREHIIRATLESLAHQTADVVDVMRSKVGHTIQEMKVDGGATANKFLMQFQADLLRMPVAVSDRNESTAWGAAKLAGKASKFWFSLRKVDQKTHYRCYFPHLKSVKTRELRATWSKAINMLCSSPV